MVLKVGPPAWIYPTLFYLQVSSNTGVGRRCTGFWHFHSLKWYLSTVHSPSYMHLNSFLTRYAIHLSYITGAIPPNSFSFRTLPFSAPPTPNDLPTLMTLNIAVELDSCGYFYIQDTFIGTQYDYNVDTVEGVHCIYYLRICMRAQKALDFCNLYADNSISVWWLPWFLYTTDITCKSEYRHDSDYTMYHRKLLLWHHYDCMDTGTVYQQCSWVLLYLWLLPLARDECPGVLFLTLHTILLDHRHCSNNAGLQV